MSAVTKPESSGNPGTTVTKRERSESFRHSLSKFEPTLVSVLPQYIKPERMIALTLTAATKNPKLFDCSMESVALSLIQVAQWDLEIGRTAHLVPFGTTCTAIADWKGLVELMLRSGHVKDVKARAVYTKEHFRVSEGLRADIEHDPIFDVASRGDLMAFYAVAFLTRGGGTFEVMTKEDVETIRSRANSKNSDAWRNHFVEMGKKTAIRRLAKRMPQTPALQSALSMDDRLDTGELLEAIRRDEQQFAPSRIQGRPQRSLAPVTQLPLKDAADGYSEPDFSAAPIRGEEDERPEARSIVAPPRTPEQRATAEHIAATATDPYADSGTASDDASSTILPIYGTSRFVMPFGGEWVGKEMRHVPTDDLKRLIAWAMKSSKGGHAAFIEAATADIDDRMEEARLAAEDAAEQGEGK